MSAADPGPESAAALRMLADRIGFDAASIGTGPIRHALEARIAATGNTSISSYLKLLKRSDAEREALVEEVVVPESWFFRDHLPFDHIRTQNVPVWLNDPNRPPPRILSLPCAGGEEPYSLAMTLIDAGLEPTRFRIDAMDVSRRQLERARRGVYRAASFRGVDLSYRDRHFEPTPEGFRIGARPRVSISWERGNLLDPALRTKNPYDVVFCRNLLIYFTDDARRRALTTLERLVVPGGTLYVGHAEVPLVRSPRFRPIRQAGAFVLQRCEADESEPEPPQRARPSAAPRFVATPSRTAEERGRGSGRPERRPMADAPPRGRTASEPSGIVGRDQVEVAANGRDWERAFELAGRLASQRPGDPEAQVLLGSIAQALGKLEDAERAFRKALYLDDRRADALLALAAIAERRGDLDAARNFRRRAALADLEGADR